MQTAARNNFITVKTEGGILPADLLQRIAEGQVEGLDPTDYHLPASERLNEAINRSWNHLLGRWQAFQEKMETAVPSQTGTTLTRDWLLTLLQELGYGRLPYQGSLSIGSGELGIGAGEKPPTPSYPISHLYDHTPIHLVTFRQELDRRDESQAIKRSPHSLLQEFLNRSDNHLWGFLSNGRFFRIIRNNVSLSRAAYVEFDLEAMFRGELYSDFSLFWLLCHQSRVETLGGRELAVGSGKDDATPHSPPPAPADCWLEKWSQQAIEQGTRALDALRDGVQEAIAALGRGFLAHRANNDLRQQLQSGSLTTQAYYRQLLRLVYRLLFLLVAEDRELLLLPDTDSSLRQRYHAYYSVSRLRQLAETRRGGPHPDLYRTLTQLFLLLRTGYEPLGLPGLGGFLFSERATPDLDEVQLANRFLLEAIRALAFTTEGKVRRPVDYKNLGSEELGSVYESLLELHPRLHVGAATFNLETAAGSERKTTGSYYTPSSLIQSLLDTALEPVVADRLVQVGSSDFSRSTAKTATTNLEEAILSIKVIDPACGSGHFLIAAARRLAHHLARVRTGDDEPGPDAVRHALRDVVGRCIYGVDINEMAVELCRVALWLETLVPGRPLSFLDKNIQCGNSLMGATPALLEEGIPDDAFTPITGDDKATCREWKKRNREQRKGQLDMFSRGAQPWQRLGNLAQALRQLETMADDTLDAVDRQRAEYERLVASGDYEFGKLWADAWCAAFVWEKRPEEQNGFPYPITEQVLREIERTPFSQPVWLRQEIVRLAEEYQFFHWHLAFPQVFTPKDLTGFQNLSGLDDDVTGWSGGFDVVLGNPPWERIKLQEKEWFASQDEEIATARNAAARRKLIRQLPQTNPDLYGAFQADKRRAEGESHFARNSGKYPLCGRGDINTYTIFAELARHIQSETGRVGVIVPSGIATDSTTQYYFQDIMDSGALVSLYDFENRNAIFPGVHRSYKFCLLTLTGPKRPSTAANFIFFALDVADLRDAERRFPLSAADIALLNPNTRTCPIFRSKRDAELTKAIYRRVPVLIKEGPPEENPWGINFLRMFDMSNDSGLFRTREELAADGWRLDGNQFVAAQSDGRLLPLYEAKMLHQFDHRWATYEGLDTRDVTAVEKNDPTHLVLPRYWVSEAEVNGRLENAQEWLLAFRNIARSTDERSALFSVIPKSGVGNSAPIVNFEEERTANILLASTFSSYIFDFITRFSLGGINFNFFIVKQLPVLSPRTYHQPCPWQPHASRFTPHASRSTVHAFLLPRILELTYTAYDLRPFAQDCGYHGPPFRWDIKQPSLVARRFLLRCELDAAYFHLYGIQRDDVAYIMDTFPIIRRKDEAAHGEYRIKRVILEIYDEMAQVASGEFAGGEYQTRLDPPPAHPDAAHPWDEAYLGPELPREQWLTIEDKQQEKDEGRGQKEEGNADKETSATPSAVKEPAPTLELKPPPASEPKAKAPPDLSAQPALVTDFTPPQGSRSQRLKAVMGLGQPKNQTELQALVSALADPDDNIRWLAGSALARLGGLAVVNMLAAFLQSDPGKTARQEALKVLGLIGDMSEDEGVQAAAMAIINERSS